MTTKHSSRSALKKQSDAIADLLKRAERGEKIDAKYAEKIEAARKEQVFNVGILMDDKVITVAIPWATIRDTSQMGLSEYILNLMQEKRHVIN